MSKQRLITLIPLLAVLISIVGPFSGSTASALSGSEFQAGRIIDDSKFFAASPMSVSDIQTFLNAKVPVCDTWGTQMHSSGQTRAQYSAANGVSTPFTCLKDFQTAIPSKVAEAGLCNGITASGATAAEILFTVGTSCGINPQVLIVLLQKEQSLITDDWPWPVQYRSATGYGCPDTAPCDAEYYGFFNQVYNAARQFKRYAQQSHLFNFKAGMNANVRYNPNVACGSSTVFLQNQATAGLYNYTPYQPNASALANLYGTGDSCGAYGNRNFWRIFNDWFGSTFGPPDYSCGYSGQNLAGEGTGVRVMPHRPSWGADRLSLIQLNNTGSRCIEGHTWAYGNYQQWVHHVATNRSAISPLSARALTADLDGNGTDELVNVEYKDTSSGMIEMHVWSPDFQHWSAHIASNRPAINPADAEVIAADANGDGRDELFLVQYRNTGSGMIEVHGWAPGFQQWSLHAATNRPIIDPADAEIISIDSNGDIKDELVLVQYRNTGSGMIEVHGWAPGFQQWSLHAATNRPAIDPGTRSNPYAEIISADTTGDLIQELILVEYKNTNSGRVELHRWASGFQQWAEHSSTNQSSY